MKILLVNTLYYPQEYGGAERMVKRLSDELLRIGHLPEVMCLSPGDDEGSEVIDGVPVHRVRLRNVYPLFPREKRSRALKPLWHVVDSFNPAMARAINDVVHRVQPQIVHTHNLTGFSPSAWSVFARRGIPIIHTLHDYYLLCPRSTMFQDGRNCASRHLQCAMLSFPRERGSRRVASVVGVSRFVLDRHLAHGVFHSAPAQHVIGNPGLRFSGSVMGRPDRGDHTLRVGYLGRLESAKGIDVLLAATSSLPASGWSLDVAGDGDEAYVAALRSRYASSKILLTGSVDPKEFLPSLDVLVVPSRSHETFGMVIAEANSAGVPVIASRVGGLPEIVNEGKTGFLVPSNSPSRLSELLLRLVAEPRIVRSMRSACVEAAGRFAPERIAREYVEAYRPLVDGPVLRSA